MRKDIMNFFKIAATIAVKRKDKRSFYLGAIGVRKDGTVVYGVNSRTKEPERKMHAEYKAAKKMDQGGIVYVARVLQSDGKFALAKPCVSCAKFMKSRRVKRCYYTISDFEFGMIDFDNFDERHYVVQGPCFHDHGE
jgi:cytidine deaminase